MVSARLDITKIAQAKKCLDTEVLMSPEKDHFVSLIAFNKYSKEVSEEIKNARNKK